jgi:hypothetical protein
LQPVQTAAPAATAASSCTAPVSAAVAVVTGDFSRLPSIVHPSYHYYGLIDLQGAQGVAGMQAMMAGWRDALAPFSIGADWMLAAEGGRVIFGWVVQVRRSLHCAATISATLELQRGMPVLVWRQ